MVEPSKNSRTAALAPEERELFRASMAEVRPLRAPSEKPVGPKPRPKAYQRQRNRRAILDEALHGGPTVPDLGDADPILFRQAGVQKRVLEQLRRGQITIKATLDLHGLTLDEALTNLAHFIEAQHQSGIASILIVHGKGLRSGAQGPVLRPAIARWLVQRRDVLAFATARQCDGGSGATYVLLKRV